MPKTKTKPKPAETITCTLALGDPDQLGNLHQSVLSVDPCAATNERSVEVSSGFGFGHLMLYVAVDGKRRLAVDTESLLRELIARALADDDRTRTDAS